MDTPTLRLPRLTAGGDERYADHTRTGRAAAEAADTGADAPMTSFDTIAAASAHLGKDDDFGVIGHDLDHPSQLHRHDYLEITHALKGTVLVWVQGETCVLEAGGTVLVKPGARHLISPIIENGRAPIEADVLIRSRLVESMLTVSSSGTHEDMALRQWLDDPSQSYCLLEAGHHPAGQAAISRMLVAYCAGERYRPNLAVIGGLLELMHTASDALESRMHIDPLIGAIIDVITKDPSRATNDGIADTLGYSVGYLSRYVRKHDGRTLGRLINEERLRQAAELLITGDQPIAEVAHAVGYDSAAYFHKLFRDRYLTTPSQYRNDFRIALTHRVLSTTIIK